MFADWIGKTETTHDVIGYSLACRMAATLGIDTSTLDSQLPLLWHWIFFQPSVPSGQLGEDGHPLTGNFLPPTANRNRMWAGGHLKFLNPLVFDQPATRKSTITNITEKQGRSGALLFVTIEHDYQQNNKSCIIERQDIVYRETVRFIGCASTPAPEVEWCEHHQTNTTTLFRYSAVTFNAHRIHYDQNYATQYEGYPGIVVQGQLLATLALNAFLNANPDAKIASFNFRSQSPIFHPNRFFTGGKRINDHNADLWVYNDKGIAQSGHVEFH